MSKIIYNIALLKKGRRKFFRFLQNFQKNVIKMYFFKKKSALISCPLSFHSTADQFPGAADQTDPQLSAHLQDAAELRLVRRVGVFAHPVPASQSPRAQVVLGL